MSRRLLWIPIGFVALYTACGDPYVASKDGGPSGGGPGPSGDETGATPTEDGGGTPPTEDSGTSPPEDTHVPPPPGTPCSTSGKAETSACGMCGTRTRVCQSSLTWSDWSECSGEGICTAFEKETAPCGTTGTKTRQCTSSCTWGSWGSCVGDAPSCGTLGATESQACGMCGTQTRSCMSSGWSSWSTCSGEGVCTPGTTDSATCTGGGTKTRTCSSTCTWGTYGACTGGTTSACASGFVGQTFSSSSFSGMYGCDGSVSHASASSLCGTGFHVCTASEFVSRRSSVIPDHHYWVSDYLNGSGSEGACRASTSTASGNFCPATAPMRVCGSTKTDASGNYCTWVGCGFESTTSSPYFGGCNDGSPAGSGLKAGALCCK